ncbi:hypothetical protein [Streptomyces sp. NPDC002690]
MSGDNYYQYGGSRIEHAQHFGSGDIVGGDKNVGVASGGPAVEALLREIERLRPHLDDNGRAEVDAAAESIATEPTPEGRRSLVQRITGIAALVGEVGLPVINAARALLAG